MPIRVHLRLLANNIDIFIIFINSLCVYSVYVYIQSVCVRVHVLGECCTMACLWKSENNLWELVLSFFFPPETWSHSIALTDLELTR